MGFDLKFETKIMDEAYTEEQLKPYIREYIPINYDLIKTTNIIKIDQQYLNYELYQNKKYVV